MINTSIMNITIVPLSALPPAYIQAFSATALRHVAIAFTVLECVFIPLRFVSKAIGRNPWGVDDVLMVFALILCLALNAFALGNGFEWFDLG